MSKDGDSATRESPAIPLRQKLVGWGFSAVQGSLFHMPGVLAYALADLLAVPLVLGSWLRERRVGRGVNRNLRIAYRDKLTKKLARRLRWAWARHMTRLMVDFARMPHIQKSNLQNYVDTSELDKLRSQVDPKQGLICVTGHIGAGDYTGHVGAVAGMPVTGVYRLPKSKPIERVILKVRCSGGQKVLSKWGSLWSMKKALDRGEVIGLAVDESTAHKPEFVPFLGTLASTSRLPAMLQIATGLPMAVVSVHRVGRLRYRFHVWDLIRYKPTGDREADIKTILTKMNAALSASILAYPEQWFWGGRRFKINPPGVEMGADGLPPAVDALPGGKAAGAVLRSGARPA